jgi:hypothetical protein
MGSPTCCGQRARLCFMYRKAYLRCSAAELSHWAAGSAAALISWVGFLPALNGWKFSLTSSHSMAPPLTNLDLNSTMQNAQALSIS